jgi:GxxExxY protein
MHADSAVLLNELSGRVIGCALTALNTLGAGFLEKVHENAPAIEMCEDGLAIVQRHCVRVRYHDIVDGAYFPDLLAEDVLLVELKTVGRRPRDAGHQLSQGDWFTTVPAAQFRQTTSGNETRGQWPLNIIRVFSVHPHLSALNPSLMQRGNIEPRGARARRRTATTR